MIIDFKYLKNRRLRYSVNKNGKEHGLYRSWHSNGNLYYELNYKNGKRHYWNYKNGKIK